MRRNERISVWSLVLVALALATGCASSKPSPDTPDAPSATPVRAEATYRVSEEEVTFEAAGMTVYGTLTRPQLEGRYAAVVLVAGSGPTDRDWNGPMLPGDNASGSRLARRLAEHGVVVLRYDKRGSGATGVPEVVDWSDYLAELDRAVGLLRARDFVADDRIVVAGHSEGGLHALRYLSKKPKAPVDAVALLATPGRALHDVLLEQVDAGLRGAGLGAEETAEQLESLDAALTTIERGEDVVPTEVSQYPGLQNLVRAFLAEDARPFTRKLLSFDPTEAIAKIDRPVLVLNGQRDIQVSHERDAERLAEAARAAKLEVTTAYPEHADHVLKYEETPVEKLDRRLVARRYNAPGRELDPAVVDAIVGWLRSMYGK